MRNGAHPRLHMSAATESLGAAAGCSKWTGMHWLPFSVYLACVPLACYADRGAFGQHRTFIAHGIVRASHSASMPLFKCLAML